MPTPGFAADAADIDRMDSRFHIQEPHRTQDYHTTPPTLRPHDRSLSQRDELYAEFAPLVKRLLRQYGTDPEMRQDLEGEIYWRFCSLVEAFDPERGVPLRPYLIRQLTMCVYTYARRQWTRKRRELSATQFDTSTLSEPGYDPTASWINELSQQHVLATLPHSIAELPDRQRKVLILRYYNELPFEEIAELLSVEASTCRSLLRHALNNLRKQLQPPACSCA